jgi:hypothetical protein
MTLTSHRDLLFFSSAISPLPNGEWECKFRGVPITGYAPTAEDAACRRFTRVVDNRPKSKPERLTNGYHYADPDKALTRAKEIALRPKYEKLAQLWEAHKTQKAKKAKKAKKKQPVQQPIFMEQIA